MIKAHHDQYLYKECDIIDSHEVAQHKESGTHKARDRNTNNFVIVRSFQSIKKSDEVDSFKKYIKCIIDLKHPCIVPFIGYILPEENRHQSSCIVTRYAENGSLLDLIINQGNGAAPDGWNFIQKIITLYGIAAAIQYIHSKNIAHGRLSASNVVLDKEFKPYITDIMLNSIYPEDINENIYMAPELYYNNDYSPKTDSFSFGILALQVLCEKINIYEGTLLDLSKLKESLTIGILPNIPNYIPDKLRELINNCLNANHEERITFEAILIKLEEVVNELDILDNTLFENFKKETLEYEDQIDEEIKMIKEAADNGDINQMYIYANARLKGKKCSQNKEEAARYFKLAAENGSDAAKKQLMIMQNEAISKELDLSKKDKNETNQEKYNYTNTNDNFDNLMDDKFFDNEKFKIDSVVSGINKYIYRESIIEFDESELTKQNFIFTDGARERLTKLYNYIQCSVPVLLEGPTGTSKTLSAEVVCSLIKIDGRNKIDLIRFNLSSETKTVDLLGYYIGDPNSWAGISMQEGPFVKAFTEGKLLILDELNLATKAVLQCIEEALDSGIISIEIPGMPLKILYMHKNFRLIATQNPNKGLFSHKRQDLGIKFLSRFQVINFPELTKEELLKIAEGLVKGFGFNGDINIIKQLVDFHIEWSTSQHVIEDVQCFTVREIAATVKAFADGENIYDTIMTIYGARYQIKKLELMKETLCKYDKLINQPEEFVYPNDFPLCFHNKALSNALKSVFFSFKNNRHVILCGAEGCGKTQVALWISEWYDKQKSDEYQKDNDFFFICTGETKCSDLIGKQKLTESAEAGSELIRWENGLLLNSVINGKSMVLDSLEEAPATVTERLNGLLDQKYDGKEAVFDVPENPANRQVTIHPDFRLLCTCSIDQIERISPAFLNRFDIIVLEDQLEEIDEQEKKDLVTLLMKRYALRSRENSTNQDMNDQSDNEFFEDGIDFDDDYDYDESDSSEISSAIIDYQPSEEIIKLIEPSFDGNNFSNLSKLCKAVAIFDQIMTPYQNIKSSEIVDFSNKILYGDSHFPIQDSILTILLSMFGKMPPNDDSAFFYDVSPLLKTFMAKLMACSLINQPVCVYAPTGAGKTSAARAFARIRWCFSRSEPQFQMHSFHSGTMTNDFYGTTTFKDHNIISHNGTLITSMCNGYTFLADEMNLSSTECMKSLAPALEPNTGRNVFCPGIERTIKIHDDFFFIACQNELGTLGRNAIPSSISSRFRYIDYPNQDPNDIASICVSILKSKYQQGEDCSTTDDEARRIGHFMYKLNQMQQRIIPQWSLRDISKIFNRIYNQESKERMFIGISVIHNVLFYTLSPVNEEDLKDIFMPVIDLVSETFNLDANAKCSLIDCYNAPPMLKDVNGRKYLMKGEIGISFSCLMLKTDNLSYSIALKSFWNSIFKVLLSDQSEPILLNGPSGFKTFLAQIFLPDSSIIALNQESTIEQLLGSSGFFSISAAKLFYLEYICKISDRKSEFATLKEKWENGKLEKSDVTSLFYERYTPFQYALNHLTDKLFELENNHSNCVLSNLTLEFQPGLFLDAILERKSLILKYLSNLPTIVLERFNELFSGKHNLTLNEDIHNTFTPDTKKELLNFSKMFRVFATCSTSSPNGLSEAVLSRFTVISIPEYTQEEQRIVLQNCLVISNKYKFNQNDINKIVQLSISCNERLKKTFTFPQIMKTIELSSKLNKDRNNRSQIQNLALISYRIFGGLLDSLKIRLQYKKYVEEIISDPNDINNQFLEDFSNDTTKSPLTLTNLNGHQGIQSCYSNLFIKSPKAKNPDMKVCFIPIFSEMIDIIHLGLLIHNPIIFEGTPGQGKQTAIKYTAEALSYQVVNIMISQSTKVDDLLGKVTITRDNKDSIQVKMIETKLIKAIKSNNELNQVIVFHNINKASPAVLNVLVTLFDTRVKEILLPNGSTIHKGRINLIGIFNSSNGIASRDKLPLSLISSSIYHVVTKLTKKDILHIIGTVFSSTQFPRDGQAFFEKFEHTRKICVESNTNVIFSVNDIIKYVKLRESTYGILDESTISQMIFAYQFPQFETIQLVLSKLGLKDMKFNPHFSFNQRNREFFIQVSKESKTGLSLSYSHDDIDLEHLEGLLNCLTLPQKHCLIFLACSIKSHRSCLIQGDTASGKSHIIRVFAQLLGKLMYVYQMNSDTGMSIFFGQSILEEKLSQNDVNNIRKALTDLRIVPSLNEYINETFDDDKSDDWTPSMFTKLFSIADEIIEKKEINDFAIKEIQAARDIIQQIILPVNRFHHVESSFIKAMNEGHWVLIDGIESAPPEIAEKLSSLCGDDPELDLFECGQGYYFSRKDVPGSRPIHKDFHLFVTFNPISTNESKTLDHSFINKCLTFTLPSVDSIPEYSAQILLGSLVNMHYPTEMSIEIGARMALMHQYARDESINDQESFAGDMKFTGRTLKFITKAFNYHSIKTNESIQQLYEPIIMSMKSFYWNSFVNTKKSIVFQEKMIEKFIERPNDEMIIRLNINQESPKSRNEPVLNELRQIQKYIFGKLQNCTVSLMSFIEKCKLIIISDLKYVLNYINDTIEMMKNRCKIDDKKGIEILTNYSWLVVIERVLKNILDKNGTLNNEQNSLYISDKDLLSNTEICNSLCYFHLICELLKDNSMYITHELPISIIDENLLNILKISNNLAMNMNMHHFEDIIKLLNENPNYISFIDGIFPYYLFYGTRFERICYIIPLIKILHESKTKFILRIFENQYEFDCQDKHDRFYVILSFDNDQPMLNNDSVIKFSKKSHKSSKESKVALNCRTEEKKIEWNNGFYGLICDLCKNEIKKFSNQIFLDILGKHKKLENPRLGKNASIKSFFQSTNSEMIAKVWAIVFYLNETGYVEDLIRYLHPIEADTLITINKCYKIISLQTIQHVIEFTKQFIILGKPHSILWKSFDNTFIIKDGISKEDAKVIINCIKEEIKDLRSFPIFEEISWSNEDYIRILEDKLQHLDNILTDSINRGKIMEIKCQFRELSNILNQIKITKNELSCLKIEMQKILCQISENNPTSEAYENAKIKVNSFIEHIQRTDDSVSQNSIIWPIYLAKNMNNFYLTNNIKLFEILIWFSKIKSIFNSIENEKSDQLTYIIDLGEFSEMKDLSQYLFSKMMNNKDGNMLIPTDFDLMESTLNAYFIYKLISSGIQIDNLGRIVEILNDYSLRENTDENEIKWAHRFSNQYPKDFKIYVPCFKPCDLLYLITNKIKNDQYVNGPLLRSIREESLNQMIKKYFDIDFDYFNDCALSIGKVAFRIYINEKDKPPSDKHELIELIKNNTKRSSKLQIDYVLKQILLIFSIAETLDKIENKKFTFDDMTFLDEEWLNNEVFIKEYPSLVYWLIKYPKCTQQIQKMFKDFKIEENALPIWIHFLRIMSSKKCIKFETEYDTEMSQIICEESRKSLLNAFDKKIDIGIEWINLFLSSVPFEIMNHQYGLIYEFLHSLSQDNYRMSKEFLCNIKKDSVRDFVRELFELILIKLNYKELISTEISNNYPLVAFIRNPAKYVKNKIEDYLVSEIESMINSISMNQYLEYCKKIITDVPEITNQLDNLITQEITEKHRIIQNKEEQKKETEIKEKCKKLREDIESYNKCLTKLHDESLKFAKVQKIVKEIDLIEEQFKCQYPDLISDSVEIEIIQLVITGNKNMKLQVVPHKKEIKIEKPDHSNSNFKKFYYFIQPFYNIGNVKNSNINPKPISKEVKMRQFNKLESVEIENYIIEKQNLTTIYSTKIHVLFGGTKDKDKYKNSLIELTDSVKQVDILFKQFKNHNIITKTFEIPKKISDGIDSIEKYSKVTFSDGKDAVGINNYIKDNIIPITAQLKKYNNIVKNKIEEKDGIYTKWKMIKHDNGISHLFSIDYSIIIPKNMNGIDKPTFSNLTHIEYLSSPILCISPDHGISCCYKKLLCKIGPLIPSLYAKPATINLINFIDEPVKCEVIMEKMQEYFTIKNEFISHEPIQISVKLPDVCTNEAVEELIEGNLIISSNSYGFFSIPIIFDMKLVPLNVLISCKEYNISYQNGVYRLVCDKIFMNEVIQFKLKNYRWVDLLECTIELISGAENTCQKPTIDFINKAQEIKLTVPNISNASRLQCILKIAFSPRFIVPISIDAAVVPFDFSFFVYDVTTKKYVDNRIEIYSHLIPNLKNIPLRCKIYSPFINKQVIAKLYYNLPPYLRINKTISNQFPVTKDFDFELSMEIPDSVYCENKSAVLSVQIEKITRKVSIVFSMEIPPYYYNRYANIYQFTSEFCHKFPILMFNKDTQEWIKVNERTNYQDYLIVTPFSVYNDKNKFIEYDNRVKIMNVKDKKDISFLFMDIKGTTKIETSDTSYIPKSWGMLRSSYSYPILGYTTNDPNKWFPVYCSFPNLENIPYLEVVEENIEVAKQALYNFYDDKMYNKIIKGEIYFQTDFFLFIILITKEAKFAIKSIIQRMPPILRVEYDEKEIPPDGTNENDLFLFIYALNFIRKTYDIFNKRFIDLGQNQFCLEYDVSPKDIQLLYQQVCEEYLSVIPPDRNDSLMQDIENKYRKMENDIKELTLIPLPKAEEVTETYLIKEKDMLNPIPKHLIEVKDDFQFIKHDQDELLSLDQLNIELPDITIPNNPTLDSLNLFYNACIQGTRILPIFMRNLKLANKKQTQAEEYFRNLLQIYYCLPPIDYSYLSLTVNSFIDSFKGMVNRLKKAGICFSWLPQSCNIYNKEQPGKDFIQIPSPEHINLCNSQWSTHTSNSHNIYSYDPPPLSQEKLDIIEKPISEDTNLPFIKDNQNASETENVFTTANYESVYTENLILANYIKEIDINEEEDEEEDISEDEGRDEGNRLLKGYVLKSNELTNTSIQSENFDGLIKSFLDEDGIFRVIMRMYEVDENASLVIAKSLDNPIDDRLLKPNKDEFPIIELINKSQYLTSQLVFAASNETIPFSNMAVDILVDCNSYISVENKIFNMMIICSLTYTLQILEIPYSVAVIADDNFRKVIKKFDEPHGVIVLQRIFDCLMIKRFITKLHNSIQFAIDHMKYPGQSRPHRAFFTFSDGLGESLVLKDEWVNRIFVEPQNSFGFVFIKSIKLKGKNLEFVEDVWKNLENAAMNAQSTVKIASIKAETSSFNLIIEMFKQVMKRTIEQQQPINIAGHLNPEFIDSQPNLSSKSIKVFDNYLNQAIKKTKSIYIQKNIVRTMKNRFDRLNTSIYRNKLSRISYCTQPNQHIECNQLIHKFNGNKHDVNHSALETVFHPNKASQYVLSNTGTYYNIIELFKYMINPTPNQLFYLEIKGGLIRNYGITVVIDSSNSCFNDFSGSHSLQTLRTLLTSLATVDLPCFDLIVASEGAPKVLCSEVSTFRALNEKSPLWESLLSVISGSPVSVDLGSAIHAAFDLRRMRSAEYENILFVLTDGLYQDNESKRIIEYLDMCVQCGVNTIGVGTGIYPVGITKLFSQAVVSPNPSLLIRGIASFFGDCLTDTFNEFPQIAIESIPDDKEIKRIFENLIKKEDDPTFIDLRNELYYIPPCLDAYHDFYNEEHEVKNARQGYFNPDGKKTELYIENLLKGQKILIVMLWSYVMNKSKESEFVDPIYLEKSFNGETESVKSCVKHYGIELKIVTNYRDAIIELVRQTKPGHCDYYAVWILCGPQYAMLPPPAFESEAHLVGQFNECLIKFWQGGGSLVFWAEGNGLCYQVNLFLETAVFPNGKSKLRIAEDNQHDGERILLGDESGLLREKMTFNRSPLNFKKSSRSSLAHNLGRIYEGITIAYAKDENELDPFTPFSRDSEGGISSMYYPADTNTGCGDIIIDCGYTKLFTQMDSAGTARYVQNIAGWTARPEIIRVMHQGMQPHEWRPKAVNHRIIENVIWPHFKEMTDIYFDIVYMVDATGSMSSYIEAAKNQCIAISEEIGRKLPGYHFQYGGIFYRDPIDSLGDKNEVIQLNNNVEILKSNIAKIVATGGGDDPEDWVGAYNHAVSTIRWRGGNRLIIHIADSPAHCSKFCGQTNHEEESGKLEPLIQRCSEMNIKVVGMCIGECPIQSFSVCKSIYPHTNDNFYDWRMFSSGDSNLEDYFKECVVNATLCAAPRK